MRIVAVATAFLLTACAAEPSSSGPTATVPPSVAAPPSVTSSPTAAPPSASSGPADVLTDQALRDVVGAAPIRAHLVELQRIADAHGGNRAAGTAGYDASVNYVARRLEMAGYTVERQQFALPSGGTSVNLIAERLGANRDSVLMLGAHLDSVAIGPGINDNGSGSMTLLVIAERLAEFASPRSTVRFAFWGAEELGEIGSAAYVQSLGAAERDRLIAYLNFDMLGSPNHVRFVYYDAGAAPGSDTFTDLFGDAFDAAGLSSDPIDLTGKSDHRPFSEAGIPTGGLFSGGQEAKTTAQAAAHGGTAGQPSDPCSHRACDTIANASDVALDEMADAIADVLVALVGG